MTVAGKKRLDGEIAELESRIPEIRQAVGEAREKGDLTENAEYQAAMESLRMAEAKMNELRDKLARAQIVDPRRAPRDRVAFGASVTLLDLDRDEKQTYRLVGYGEDEASENSILTTSPVGQALLLKKVGEEVEIEVPRGTVRYRVLEINYPG
jgi:transcription elongation factor GreA